MDSTVLAAVVAAGVSLIALLANVIVSWRGRVASRKAIQLQEQLSRQARILEEWRSLETAAELLRINIWTIRTELDCPRSLNQPLMTWSRKNGQDVKPLSVFSVDASLQTLGG